jgi:hypothetical protein
MIDEAKETAKKALKKFAIEADMALYIKNKFD